MKKVRLVLILLIAALTLLFLSGCRSRTTAFMENPEVSQAEENSPSETSEPTTTESPQTEPPSETTTAETPPQESAESDPDTPTEENSDSPRKAYAEDAPAEMAFGADNQIVAEQPIPSAPPAPAKNDDAAEDGAHESDESGGETVTVTVPSETAEDLGADDNAEAADTVLSYYQTLLSDRLSSLFECQRLYIYWETEINYTTVLNTSAEHRLILESGGYNVSAKLLEDALTVDDGWVSRKNPGAIVKCVDSFILGAGVGSTASAAAVRDSLVARPDWEGIDAVQNGRVLILSRDLLSTEAGRTAAAIYIAKLIFPDLMGDVDADEALRLLTEEENGVAATGIYAYAG